MCALPTIYLLCPFAKSNGDWLCQSSVILNSYVRMSLTHHLQHDSAGLRKHLQEHSQFSSYSSTPIFYKSDNSSELVNCSLLRPYWITLIPLPIESWQVRVSGSECYFSLAKMIYISFNCDWGCFSLFGGIFPIMSCCNSLGKAN